MDEVDPTAEHETVGYPRACRAGGGLLGLA